MFSSTLLLLALIPASLADFQNFSLQVNTTEAKCGQMPFGCGGDAVCAYDDRLQRYYCCEVGSDGLCQTFQNQGNCEGRNNTPTDDQISCDRFGEKWCCLKDLEKCTVRGDNINLCWSNAENPFAQVNSTRFGEIYVSLEAANPDASTIALDTSSLFAELSGTSTLSSATDSPTAPPPPQDSDSGLSGGAIGGIVVGVVAGLAVVIGAVWFFLRKRKQNKSSSPHEGAAFLGNQNQHHAGDQHVYAKVQPQAPQQEYRAELESQPMQQPVELDTRQGNNQWK